MLGTQLDVRRNGDVAPRHGWPSAIHEFFYCQQHQWVSTAKVRKGDSLNYINYIIFQFFF